MHPLLALLLMVCCGFFAVMIYKFILYVRLTPELINWCSWDDVFRGYVKFWNEIPIGATEVEKIGPFVVHSGTPAVDLTGLSGELNTLEKDEELFLEEYNECIESKE